MRVTDDNVEGFLIWARNYGEIESFERIAPRGRKWLIRLPDGPEITASGQAISWTERRHVPREMVLTSREALAFGYGLAIAGREPRAAHAAREWGWT